MVNLQQYEDYWNVVKNNIPGIGKIVPITFDADIAPYVQALKSADLPVLFIINPTSEPDNDDPDSNLEINYSMFLLLDKIDVQRKKTSQIQKELQPVFEKIKAKMKSEYGCNGLLSDLIISSMKSVPEAGLFASMSGWSLSFNFKSE